MDTSRIIWKVSCLPSMGCFVMVLRRLGIAPFMFIFVCFFISIFTSHEIVFTGFSRLVACGRLPGECQRHYCTDWYDLIIFLNFIKDQLFCSFKQELAFNCCIFPYRKSESWPSPQGSPCLQLWRPPGRNNSHRVESWNRSHSTHLITEVLHSQGCGTITEDVIHH